MSPTDVSSMPDPSTFVGGGVAYACAECLTSWGTDPAIAAAAAVLIGVWIPRVLTASLAYYNRPKTPEKDE